MPAVVLGADQLIARLGQAAARLKARKPEYVRRCGTEVAAAIAEQISTKLQYRTGNLLGSIRLFNQTANGISIGTGKDVEYVRPLEFGSREHIIRAGGSTQGVFGGEVGHYRLMTPTGVRMLHFYDSNGEERYAYSVLHPGNRPYAFVRGGAEQAFVPIAFQSQQFLREIFGVPL